MKNFHSQSLNKTREPSPRGRFSSFFGQGERGNALLYVFIAVGLLAALTYAYTRDSRENYSTQASISVSEELAAQANTIRTAVVQCTLEYPGGGGDMDSSGVIDSSDNDNTPYPLTPNDTRITHAESGGCTTTSNATGCIQAAADGYARSLTCIGAPAGEGNMFQGSNNQGRILPPPPTGFTEWLYKNDTHGVYIQTTAPDDVAATMALTRVMDKFPSSMAELNYGSCGARCLTVWIVKK